MKTHVVKTTPEASLAEAVDLMDIYQVDSLPVVDSNGRLCGIIAEQDVAAVLRSACDAVADSGDAEWAAAFLSRSAASAAERPVVGAMTETVQSVDEDADVAGALRSFFVNDFTRLPVTDLDGAVIGTLNRIDILQAIFEGTARELG
jgi:CBS domain-containing protein